MGKRNFEPRSQQENERLISRQHKGFGLGAFDDIAGSSIPEGGIKYAKNYQLFPDRAETRAGTKKWSTTVLPSLKTGISVTKSGAVATRSAGPEFDPYDVGRYLVYDDGKHELIIGFTDGNNVTVENTTSHAGSTAAWTRGSYEWWYHKFKNKIVLHIDGRLFISDPVTISWTECYRIGHINLDDAPAKSFEELGEYAIIGTKNGLVKLNLTTYHFYPLNTRVPTVRVTDVAKTSSLPYGYRVLYTMSRITGTLPTRNRYTSGVSIELESGSTQPGDSDKKDYGEIWTTRPLGEASTYYGVLTCIAPPNGSYDSVAEWQAITDGQFKITISGTQQNVGPLDFSSDESWAEMAKTIKLGLKDVFTDNDLDCEWVTDHFVITNNDEGGTVSVASSGDAGTDISTIMGGAGGTATTPDFTSMKSIGTLTMPVSPNDSTKKRQHWTHYSVYRTFNIGKGGIDPQTGAGNSTETYTHDMDVPVAKAFTGSVSSNVITSSESIFDRSDVGDTIKFQDGTEVTITGYTSATQMSCSHADVSSQSAALGNGSVITASQTGTTVTRSAGDTFSLSDVGKVIFWANGLRSTIKTYTDPNTVTVYESQEISSQSATFDPVSRTISIYSRDTYNGTDSTVISLSGRDGYFNLYTRFFSALPSDCDVFAIVNGMMVAGKRDGSNVYFSQVPNHYEYLTGYYNEFQQVTELKDRLKHIVKFHDQVAILMSHSILGIPLNSLSEDNGVFFPSGKYDVSQQIGCVDWGSVAKIGDSDVYQFLTSEPAMRQISVVDSGRIQLGANLAFQRMMKKLQKSNFESASGYEIDRGYVIWTRDTQKLIPSTADSQNNYWNLALSDDEQYSLILVQNDSVDFKLTI